MTAPRSWPAIDVDGLATPAHRESLQTALTDLEIAAIDETVADRWRVFFPTPAERDRALVDLARRFPDLRIEPIDVPDDDWAARSQSGLRAVQIGRLIVAPPWDVPIVVTVKPSTGFGTGHHATTRLCLLALQRLDLRERSVLDIGTGSGILAIAASLLGGGPVTGVDDDPDAVRAAWDNLALNPGATVTLIAGDFRSLDLVPASVVVANLTGGLLAAAGRRLRDLVAGSGRLIVSGFRAPEEGAVRGALAAFVVEHRAEEEGWVCLTLV